MGKGATPMPPMAWIVFRTTIPATVRVGVVAKAVRRVAARIAARASWGKRQNPTDVCCTTES